MAPSREYIQFSAFLELIESMSAGRQTESVMFRDDAGRVVGLLTLDNGQVRFGVHLFGRLYIDELLLDEAPRHAVALQKILSRASLTRTEKELLADVSSQHHAALCGLTARALRKIAALYMPTRQPGRRPEVGHPQLRLLNAAFSPVELALAAARRGSIRSDDAAVRVYANPPEHAEESWLFEWQPDDSGSPWPVQTGRLGERRVPDLAAFGALGQQLTGLFLAPRRLGDKNKRRIQLLRVSESLFFLVSSMRYLAVLQYHQANLGRLLKTMEDLVGEVPARVPDLGAPPRSRISPPPAPAPLAGALRLSPLPPPRPAPARAMKQADPLPPRGRPMTQAKVAANVQATQVQPLAPPAPAPAPAAAPQVESELQRIDEAAWVEAASQLVDDTAWLDATSLLVSEDAAPPAAGETQPAGAGSAAPAEAAVALPAIAAPQPGGLSGAPPEPTPEPAPSESVPAASEPSAQPTLSERTPEPAPSESVPAESEPSTQPTLSERTPEPAPSESVPAASEPSAQPTLSEPTPEPAPSESVPAESEPSTQPTLSEPTPEPVVVVPEISVPPSATQEQSKAVLEARPAPSAPRAEAAPPQQGPPATPVTPLAGSFKHVLLSLQKLTARVQGRTVLKDVELELGTRGVYALMGPGGSGKSSLGGILCGRNRAASGWDLAGELRYDGAPLGSGARPVLIGQKISRSTLPLRAYLVADLDDGIAGSVTDARLGELLARVRLQRLAGSLRSALGSPALQLSGSEWWRLAIARELMADPRMLCLDEPTAGMDDEEAAPILDLIHEEGARRAVLFVTHNQQHARRCSDYVILLASGKVQEYRPTPEFFSSPLSRSAQDYVRTGGCYVPSPDAREEQLDEDLGFAGQAETPPSVPPPPETPSPSPSAVSEPAPAPAGAGAASALPPEPEPSEIRWQCPSPLLSARGFTLRIGERAIFSQLSFDVAPRGAFLIGAENSGERRLLIRALCGPRPGNFQISGRLRYQGQDLLENNGPATPQMSAQLLMMQAADYLASNLRTRSGLTQAEQRAQARKLVDRFGPAELRERLHLELTSLEPLERRCLEILRAIAPDPPLLVLEDPLSGLALAEQERLLALLRQQVQQRAVLILAQDPAPYAPLGPAIAWLAQGRMFAQPPPKDPADGAASPPVAPTEVKRDLSPPVVPPGEPIARPEQPAPLISEAQSAAPRGQGPRGFQWLREGALAGMPAPGLTHEMNYDLDLVRRAGVTCVVTLTTEPVPPDALRVHGLHSVFFPIEDMDAPTEQRAAELAANVADRIARQQVVVFHCKAGLGRTGTMLAAQLIWEGMDAASALARVRAVEPGWVQSEKQVLFLSRYEQWLRRERAQGNAAWQHHAQSQQVRQ